MVSLSWLYRNPLRTAVGAILLYLVLLAVYVYTTQFRKQVTVVDRGVVGIGKSVYTTVTDDNGQVYFITNQILLLHLKSMEVAGILKNGSKFEVTGYGMHIPDIGIYQNIVSARKLSA